MSVDKFLLISGEGAFPSIIYHSALKKKIEVIWVGFQFLHYNIEEVPHHFIDTFSFSSILHLAQTYQVEYLCLAGKVARFYLFQEKYIGNDLSSFLNQLSGHRDDQVLNALFREFDRYGLKLVSPAEFLSHTITPWGNLTKRVPDENEWGDIQYGLKLAQYLADHEVGQTLVLKRKAILAIEAAEGTDETIQRGALLGGGNVVVVKMARTRQNFFLDIPAIGIITVQILGQNGGGILAVEQGKTLLMNREELICIANELGVGVVGIST